MFDVPQAKIGRDYSVWNLKQASYLKEVNNIAQHRILLNLNVPNSE